MNNYHREIVNRPGGMPIEQARLEIAWGAFGDIGSPNHSFASSWLSAREASIRDGRETEMVSLLRKTGAKEEPLMKGAPRISVATDTWKKIEQEILPFFSSGLNILAPYSIT